MHPLEVAVIFGSPSRCVFRRGAISRESNGYGYTAGSLQHEDVVTFRGYVTSAGGVVARTQLLRCCCLYI